MSNESLTRPPRRTRKWLLALALLAAVLAIAVWRASDAESYRGLLTRELSKAIQLPVAFGPLDLRWTLPPTFTARAVEVGDADFGATVERVTARLRLRSLLRGVVNIDAIDVEGLVARFPEDDAAFRERIEEFAARFSEEQASPAEAETPPAPKPQSAAAAAPPGKRFPLVQFRIGRVTAREAVALRGGRRAVHGGIEVREVLSDELGIDADFLLPWFDEDTRFALALQLTPQAEAGPGIEGFARLENFDIEDAVRKEGVPHARIGLEARVGGVVPDDLSFTLQGSVHRDDPGGPVDGAITGNAWLKGAEFTVNDFTWESPGLHVTADATMSEAQPFACRVTKAEAEAMGLQTVLALLAPEGFVLEAEDGARVDIADLLFGVDAEGALRLSSGSASFGGIRIARAGEAAGIGGIRGSLRLEENLIRVEEAAAEGVRIEGSVRPDLNAGAADVDMRGEARLTPALLAAWLPSESVERLSGTLTLAKLTGRIGGDAPFPGGIAAEARLENLDARVRLPDAEQPVDAKKVSGGITLQDGVVTFDKIAGEGFRIDGTLAPDFETGAFSVDLNAEADLASGMIAALLPKGTVSGMAGTLKLDRVAARYDPKQGAPENIVVQGGVSKGRMTLALEEYPDTISDLRASFNTEAQDVAVSAGAVSERLGALTWEGRYAGASRELRGVLTMDLARAAGAIITDAEARRYANALMSAYGVSNFDVIARLPGPDAAGASVALTRQGAPPLSASAEFSGSAGDLALAALQARTEAPLSGLASAVPKEVEIGGSAVAVLSTDPAAGRFTAEIDLDRMQARAGEYLRKKAGVPARLTLAGAAGQQWKAESLEARLNEESVLLALVDGGVRADALDFDLSALGALLPEKGSASGRIRGRFDTAAQTADLRLERAALALAPDLALDAITGDIALRDGYWTGKDIRVKGADSDCTVNAEWKGGAWEASVLGEKLNVNALMAMGAAFGSFQGQRKTAPAAGAPPQFAAPAPVSVAAVPAPRPPFGGISGTVRVDIKSLYFRRGRIDNLRAAAALTPEAIDVRDISLRPYSGTVTGAIRVAHPREGYAGDAAIKLDVQNMDLRLLDEILFEEPRNFHGAVTGEVDLRFPLGEKETVANGLNGRVLFTATNGSYGKLGLATRLLTVLRTTEIIRLRVPTLRDEGLVYDSSICDAMMTEGVIALNRFTITGKAYAMEGAGTIDFPRNASNVEIGVNPLEAVTGIVDRVPILSQATKVFTDRFTLIVRMSGSPWDPAFKTERERGLIKELRNLSEEADNFLNRLRL